MSLSLNATLATAQDNTVRKPIAEITSSQWEADIPFDGSYVTVNTQAETDPNTVTLSDGRIALVYRYDTGTTETILYRYTDTSRQSWTEVQIGLLTAHTLVGVSICELVNNNIGLIYLTSAGGVYHLYYRTMTVAGVLVASGEIGNWLTTTWTSDPFVLTLANDTYLMVYGKASGANYEIYKRTSSDFITWSAESALSITGLTSTQRRDNPSLTQITTGDIFLWFDYVDSIGPNDEELVNIYYSISTDNGATWGAAVQVTAYTTYAAVGKHPVAVQKVANQLHLLFYEQNSALYMNENSTGWDAGDGSVTDISFDAVTRKLYVVSTNTGLGDKYLYGVAKIDVDTWTIDKWWDDTTVPAFNAAWGEKTVGWFKYHGEGAFVPVGINETGQIHVALLDGDSDTITHYYFNDWSTYSITQNVTWTDEGVNALNRAWVDLASNRLYLALTKTTASSRVLQVGYIDITEVGPSYTFTTVMTETNQVGESTMTGFSDMLIVPTDDYIIISYNPSISSWKGRLRIHLLSTGALYKDFTVDSNPAFPYNGMGKLGFYNGKVYGGFDYQTAYGEGDKRGLCEVDVATGVILFHRPTWASIDDYNIHSLVLTDDNKFFVSCVGYGVTLFDPLTLSWTLFDNDTLPGMTPSGTENFYPITYDASAGLVYVGEVSDGAIAFSRYGYIKQTQYMIGTYVASWSFAAAADLVQGLQDYDLVAALDPTDQSMYVFWTRQETTAYSTMWDKESTTLELSDLILKETEIKIMRSIDRLNQLTFSVSHGHLFDPHNSLSLWSIYLRKGRKLVVRFGENVGGVEYWQNQGTFSVTELSLTYQRGEYPIANIVAEDRRVFWKDHRVVTTAYYDGEYPEDIISDILQDHISVEAADIELPTFSGRTELWNQWVDLDVKTIVDEICDRYGYRIKVDVDDDITATKISDSNSVNHTYTDTTKLINFTPDDSYSDFVNRITVTSEERTFIEVLYAEEMITSLAGTIGWWGYKNDFTVYYSEDHSRRARYPRLNVIESATSIAFKLVGQIDEEISSTDTDEKYCVVTISAPNLIPMLLAAIATAITGYAMGDGVTNVPGTTTPIGRVVEKTGIIAALLILASTGNFQYELWAQPVGYVKREIQGTANDTELQTELGSVIENRFENPLCYSPGECEDVAEQELLITQLQRNRVKFTKVTHLQDEEGDTIVVPHPYTADNMTIFVTSLTRRMKVPLTQGDEGYFLDDIEGWVL